LSDSTPGTDREIPSILGEFIPELVDAS